jgi:hypothetical protein
VDVGHKPNHVNSTSLFSLMFPLLFRYYSIFKWALIHIQPLPNYCTTPRHIGVGSTQWAPPQYALELCNSWVGVVILAFSFLNLYTNLNMVKYMKNILYFSYISYLVDVIIFSIYMLVIIKS